ncbi:MAG: hypothetical protein ACI97A_003412 [Planctomycetota bacterium]|jgi:hypothetical protein
MTITEQLLLQSQLILAAAMTGIIWLVQFVTYPQFLNVGGSEFDVYHKHHTAGIGRIVAPLMIVELGLSIWAVWHFRDTQIGAVILAATAITLAIWVTTFAVQVPLHKLLVSRWSEPVIRKLISTNWIRTILWSARLGLIGWAIFNGQ